MSPEERDERARLKIQARIGESKGQKRDRMGACMSYFAIIKGYCTMSMFNLPIGFKYGGWLFSPLVLFMACFVETFSAVRLCQAAREAEIYNYPDLVEYVLGKTARGVI